MTPPPPSDANFVPLTRTDGHDPPGGDRPAGSPRGADRIGELLALARTTVEQQPAPPGLLDRFRAGFLRRVQEHTLPEGATWFEDLAHADESTARDALRQIVHQYEPVLRRDLERAADASPELIEAVVREVWESLWRKRGKWPSGQVGLDRIFRRADSLLRTYAGLLRTKLEPLTPAPEPTERPHPAPAPPPAGVRVNRQLIECLRKRFPDLSEEDWAFVRTLTAGEPDPVCVTPELCQHLGMTPEEVQKRLKSLFVRLGKGVLATPARG